MIDFITKNKDEEEEDQKKNKEGDAPGMEWTNPPPGQSKSVKSGDISAVSSDINHGQQDKQKGGSATKENEAGQDKPATGSLFNRLFDRRASPSEKKSFKKDKEDLKDYHEALKEEKNERGQKTEFASTAPILASPPAKDKKIEIKNIGEIIKKRLLSRYSDLMAPRTLKTNLIKGEITTFFDWKKNLGVLFSKIFYSSIIVAVIYVGLIFWESKISERGESILEDIKEIITKIEQAEKSAKKVDVFRKKFEVASHLLNRHIYWTNFFKFLEENTLAKVFYTEDFVGDTKGRYTFKAETENYTNIVNQVRVLREHKDVIGVKIDSANLAKSKDEESEDVVAEFSLEIVLNPSIFYK